MPRGNQPRQPQRQSQSQQGSVNTAQKRTAARSPTIELGIPALLYGQSLALIPFAFWIGILGMSLSALWLGWLLFRFYTGKVPRWSAAIVTMAAHAVILWIFFKPPPMRVDLLPSLANYPDGTDVYGITWKSNYSELSVALFNDADIDYINVDVRIQTNLGFEKGVIVPGVNQCSLGFDMDIPGHRLSDARLTPVNPKDQEVFLPFLTPFGGSLYRLRCARFASKSRIDAVFAITAPSAKREVPGRAMLSGDYETNFWSRPVIQCLQGKC
jgi:hypothetical protein